LFLSAFVFQKFIGGKQRMKEVNTMKVRRILRRVDVGNSIGRAAISVLRRKSIPINILFSLGNELENRGLMMRSEFIRACKA
jgi:hypothetical protein